MKPHDNLIAITANILESETTLVFYENRLGSHEYCIADVMTINKDLDQLDAHIYECKVTYSDYEGDVSTGKYKKYLEHGQLTFVVLPGFAEDAERILPDGVGLATSEGVLIVKCSTPKVSIPIDFLVPFLAKSAGSIFDPVAISFISHVNDQKSELRGLNAPIGMGDEVKEALSTASSKVTAAKSQLKSSLSVQLLDTASPELFWSDIDTSITKFKSDISFLAGGLIRHIDEAFHTLNSEMFQGSMGDL